MPSKAEPRLPPANKERLPSPSTKDPTVESLVGEDPSDAVEVDERVEDREDL